MKGETQRGGRQTESELVEKLEQKVRVEAVELLYGNLLKQV